VDAYLLDTSALTPLVDPGHVKHQSATAIIVSLGSAPVYVSVVALAEMQYGFQLFEKTQGTALPDAAKMMAAAQNYPRLDIAQHTATAYAELKSALAVHYLPNVTKTFRKKYVEDWIDKATGKALMVDDNDLWVCAQARETNYVLIAGDKMETIRKADPLLKLLLIT
jgi:tRNA(fMet)-specific endonuclease VapC